MDEQREMSDVSTLPEALYNQAVNREEFCDVTLEFGDRVMGAHWYVLMVQSGYFQGMYRSRLKEKQKGTVKVNEGTEEAIKLAIKYLYTGEVTLDDSYVEEILHIADYLQIPSLTDECNKYLVNTRWGLKTCWKYYALAKRYRLNLFEDLVGYISANLTDIVGHSSDIKQMTSKDVEEIGKDLERHKASLEGRFLFYHEWLSCDFENRRTTFERLFCTLNLKDSKHTDFENLSKHAGLLQNFRKSWEYYLETMCLALDCQLKMTLKTNVILVLTKYGLNDTRLCTYAYIISQQRWVFVATLPAEVNPDAIIDVFIAVNEAENCLYAVGDSTYHQLCVGETESIQTCYVLVHKYDMIRKAWCKLEVNLNVKEPNCIEIKGLAWINNKVCIVVKSSSHCGDSVMLCLLETNDCCCSVSPLIKLPANMNIVDVDSCVVDGVYMVVRCCYFNTEGSMSETMAVKHVSSWPTWPTAPALYTFSTKLPGVTEILARQRFMFPTYGGVIRSGISTSGYLYLNVVLELTSVVKETILPGHLLRPSGENEATHSAQVYIVHGTSLNTVYIHNPDANVIHVFDFSQRSSNQIAAPPGQLHRTKCVPGFLLSSVFKRIEQCPLCAFEQSVNSK